MKRKLKAVVGVICAMALMASCTPAKDPVKKPAGTTDKREVNAKQGNLDILNPIAYSDPSGIHLEPGSYISIIGKTNGGAYWDEVKAGAEKAAEDLNKALGYKGEDKIRVNFSGPAKGENVEEQINILDEELARNPVAVGIAIIDSGACGVQFELAAENGIPIIAFDSGSDFKDIQAMCSTDNQAIGKLAAEKLSSYIDDQGEVAVFVHDKESTNGKQRRDAFLKEMKENHPDVKIPVIYHLDEQAELAKKIADEKNAEKVEDEAEILPEDITQNEIIRYLLEKNPNIKGCYTTNIHTTQKLLEVLGDMGKEDLAIVGTDGGSKQLKALEDGKVKGLIVQNPYGMGYAAVIAASRASLEMGNQAFVDTGFVWVTQENIEKKVIQKMLY